MLNGIRSRLCGDAVHRADQALAASEVNRVQRQRAVATSRSSDRLMNEALKKLYDALQRSAQ